MEENKLRNSNIELLRFVLMFFIFFMAYISTCL